MWIETSGRSVGKGFYMYTLLVTIAVLVTLYGLAWHDSPAKHSEEQKRHTNNH